MPRHLKPCPHATLRLEPSACAARVGFEAVPPAEILAAASRSSRKSPQHASSTDASRSAAAAAAAAEEEEGIRAFFPAPLVLPGDELAYEPDEEGQSFAEWLGEEERNKPTRRRGVLYVAAAPQVAREVGHIEAWTRPRGTAARQADKTSKKRAAVTKEGGISHLLQPPRAEDIIDFLAAFYHGMQVKPFPESLQFVPWDGEQDDDDDAVAAGKVSYIGLAAGDSCTRIRVRRPGLPTSPSSASSSSSPPAKDDDGGGSVFEAQLNLEDILDAAIAMLPRDAYSILVLVDHDLYETDDDDFCCGRAYGGSRVCVVQSARYHPALDATAGIDRAHMWPASHCGAYMDGLCRAEGISVKKSSSAAAAAAAVRGSKTTSSTQGRSTAPPSALQLAVAAAATAAQQPGTTAGDGDDAEHEVRRLQGLWLSRLARTAAHELGHCFGMDHCVYAACLMQGTACMAEDVRQPPYLCAVCAAKVGHAVAGELLGLPDGRGRGGGGGRGKGTRRGGHRDEDEKRPGSREQTAYLVERYRAIADFCEKWTAHVGMFAGYRAWANARIEKMLETTV